MLHQKGRKGQLTNGIENLIDLNNVPNHFAKVKYATAQTDTGLNDFTRLTSSEEMRKNRVTIVTSKQIVYEGAEFSLIARSHDQKENCHNTMYVAHSNRANYG